MKIIKSILIVFILLTISSTQVSADISPPEPPSGTNPKPGNEITNVRMMSETVLIEINANSPFDNGYGSVTVTFTMRNLGDVDEQMDVRFPLDQTISWGNLCSAPSFINTTIDDIQVKVNGNPVSTETSYQTVPVILGEEPYPTQTIPCWANFPVTFPAGKDVIIQVTYTAEPYTFGGYHYSYVLITGAGWKDTIGSADIIFKIPYELNALNFISCLPKDCSVKENTVQWHYENFEPTSNVILALSSPPLWQRILLETQNTTQYPNDGEAWGRLAKAYKESIIGERWGYRDNVAGQEMYQLSKEAYQKAVTLLPNDVDWHYGFADLLCRNAGYNNFLVNSATAAWVECVQQIQQVLNLNPNHESTKEMIEYYGNFDGMIDFSDPQPNYLILTPQPTATVVSTQAPIQPTATLTATASPLIQVTKTKKTQLEITNTPTSTTNLTKTKTNTPILIGSAILLFIVSFIVIRSRKQ